MLANLSLLHLMPLPKIVCEVFLSPRICTEGKTPKKPITMLWKVILLMVKPEQLVRYQSPKHWGDRAE